MKQVTSPAGGRYCASGEEGRAARGAVPGGKVRKLAAEHAIIAAAANVA
jgi:hypothetical protein